MISADETPARQLATARVCATSRSFPNTHAIIPPFLGRFPCQTTPILPFPNSSSRKAVAIEDLAPDPAVPGPVDAASRHALDSEDVLPYDYVGAVSGQLRSGTAILAVNHWLEARATWPGK